MTSRRRQNTARAPEIRSSPELQRITARPRVARKTITIYR
jgi:hypothetical protein